jgi:hypothetical protein
MDHPNPDTTKPEHLEQNLGALEIHPKEEDDEPPPADGSGFSKIHLQGSRAPKDLMALVDVEAKLESE